MLAKLSELITPGNTAQSHIKLLLYLGSRNAAGGHKGNQKKTSDSLRHLPSEQF